jgi:hypothetical protein
MKKISSTLLLLTFFISLPTVAAGSPNGPSKGTAVLTTYENGTRGNVRITWQDNSSDETYFSLRRKQTGKQLEFLGTTTANTLRYDDTTLGTGTYLYGIRGCNASGCSNEIYTNTIYFATQLSDEPVATTTPNPYSYATLFRNLQLGDTGEDVVTLQKFLVSKSLLKKDSVTGIFGPKTKAAVKVFQMEYKDELLQPYGYSQGTGSIGPLTRKKINSLLEEVAIRRVSQP